MKDFCRLGARKPKRDYDTIFLFRYTKFWIYQLSSQGKLATVKRSKADASSVSPSLALRIRSDEGLTLETSAFNLFTVANLPYQLS